jgi:hypothetical protein
MANQIEILIIAAISAVGLIAVGRAIVRGFSASATGRCPRLQIRPTVLINEVVPSCGISVVFGH